MKAILILIFAPALGLGYLVYSLILGHQNSLTNEAIANGIAAYKKQHTGWPHGFSDLQPYLQESQRYQSVDPTFLPLGESKACMEENVSTTTGTKRMRFTVTAQADGSYTIQPGQDF